MTDPQRTAEWYRQQIEQRAPQKPGYTDSRQHLVYKELDSLPRHIEMAVLEKIYWAQITERTFKKLEANGMTTETYLGDIRRIDELLGELQEALNSPVVYEKPKIGPVKFYMPHEVYCRHNRLTNDCIAIHKTLDKLADVEKELADAEKLTAEACQAKSRLQGRRSLLVQRLRQQDIDPSSALPANFCASYEPGEGDPFALADLRGQRTLIRPRRPGIPPDLFQDSLVRDVVGRLVAAGWSAKRACGLLHHVCVLCLDMPETGTGSVEAILKRWKRLQKRVSTAPLPPASSLPGDK